MKTFHPLEVIKTLPRIIARDETCSVVGATFNLMNSIVGAGLVAMPYAIKECGLISGTILLVLLCYACSKSIVMLAQCAIKARVGSLEQLCDYHFGSRCYDCIAILMMMYSTGNMVACLVVIGDTLPPILNIWFDLDHTALREICILLVAMFALLPLVLFKNLATLSFVGVASFGATILLVIFVAIAGPHSSRQHHASFDQDVDMTVVSSDIFAGIGTISFHFMCQHSCLLVFGGLEVPNVSNIKKVVKYSLGTVLLLTLVIGVTGYICFNHTTDPNILNNFYRNDRLITVARFLMTFIMVFTYPMACFVVRHAVFALLTKYFPLDTHVRNIVNQSEEDNGQWNNIPNHLVNNMDTHDEHGQVLRQWKSIEPHGSSRDVNDTRSWPTSIHRVISISLLCTTVGLSLLFKDIATVLEFVGIFAASIMGFILPGAIFCKVHETEIRRKLYTLGVHTDSESDVRGLFPENQKTSVDRDYKDSKLYFYCCLAVFGVVVMLCGVYSEISELVRGKFRSDSALENY